MNTRIIMNHKGQLEDCRKPSLVRLGIKFCIPRQMRIPNSQSNPTPITPLARSIPTQCIPTQPQKKTHKA